MVPDLNLRSSKWNIYGRPFDLLNAWNYRSRFLLWIIKLLLLLSIFLKFHCRNVHQQRNHLIELCSNNTENVYLYDLPIHVCMVYLSKEVQCALSEVLYILKAKSIIVQFQSFVVVQREILLSFKVSIILSCYFLLKFYYNYC